MTVKHLVLALLPLVLSPLSACIGTGPENQPPLVSIIQPGAGEAFVVGDTVTLVAEASDDDGIVTSVSFYVEERLLGTDDAVPYTVTWNTAGTERLYSSISAVAQDDQGAYGDDVLRVRTDWVYEPPEQIADGWQTASLEDVEVDPGPLVQLINTLRSRESHRVHGIVLVRHGLLVFEHYFSGLTHPTWGEEPVTFDRETAHVLSSVTKSFTATLLGIAIDRGFISSVDDTVFDFYPELADLNTGRKRGITLRHLITMSSGLEWNESSATLGDPSNHLTALIRRAMNTSQDLIRFILEKPMVADPGTWFNYSGGNTNVVGNVIQRASGTRLDRFADEYLFEPLGIETSWWWLLRPDFVYASGDLALVPRDMAKFGQLFLQNGSWNGEQLVSQEWVGLSAEPVFLFSPPDWSLSYGFIGYSHGWWPNEASYGAGAFSASGWGGQQIVVMPEFEMVAALTGGSYWDAPSMTTHQIMQYVLEAVQ
ncbi:MAG: serine hydrolase [Gemmatimonadota bacterium]|nr:MAG: serine hydrolase [Gemmatimonadota bacterium]